MESQLKKTPGYAGIDLFRIVAAFLVITIHTSPLLTFSKAADDLLTHAIARIAVPFFFMTSGFFLISRYGRGAKKLLTFEKKTLWIYLAAILLYLPVNLYSGYFTREDPLLPRIIQDLLFHGTLYHLWYLPASMIGAMIAFRLVRSKGYGKAVILTGALYLIGLFGDSYYGLSRLVPVLYSGYHYLFQIMDYTRGGLFFAPLFFVLGGLLADCRFRITRAKALAGSCMSMVGMCAEAVLVRRFDLARHDSMYFCLVPLVFFLFLFLLTFSGARRKKARTFALLLYLIHPMMILAVRLCAKKLLLQDLLIENSLGHFLAVCLLSVLSSGILTIILQKAFSSNRSNLSGKDRAWIEIDLQNLEHNVKELKKALPASCELMAVVKTEAYGHGAYEVATYLDRIGVRAYAVSTIEEGIRLRRYGVRGTILILGFADPARVLEIKKYHLTQTIVDFAHAAEMNRKRVSVQVHLKIDTGMHRLGIPYYAISELQEIFQMKYLKISGIYSHLSCADSLSPEDVTFSNLQIARFYHAAKELKKRGIEIPKLHIQSSYGVLNYPDLKADYARCGIALYGALSSPGDQTRLSPDLKPVLSVKARITHLARIKKGETVGYGRAYKAERDRLIAAVSIGYGDGIPRRYSESAGGVLIRGQFAPVIGRISMDQLTIDITEIADVRRGEIATVITPFSDGPLSAEHIASKTGTITNELLSRLGSRLRQ